MSAREEILGRVRAGVGKDDFAARRAAAELRLMNRPLGPQPRLGEDLAARFMAKAESLSSTLDRVATLAEVPAAVARYLAQHGLGDEAVATDEAAALDWSASGLRVTGRAAVDADRVGITGCFCAIAETGTLLLLSGPTSPASVSLLPETHIAFIPASRILGTMEAAFDRLRIEQGSLPRALNFISGPSRTGDIEQTIVLGAHGPCRVHLILVEQA